MMVYDGTMTYTKEFWSNWRASNPAEIDSDRECVKCNKVKPADEFPMRRDRLGNLRWRRRACKRCLIARAPYQRNYRYGLTPQAYDALLAKQGGHCVLCSETEGLEVDHDHKCCPKRPTCGKCTRGLLCDSHNRALGYFTTEQLRAACNYVVQFQCPK